MANRYVVTMLKPLQYELVDDSADFGEWLRDCYTYPCACDVGELTEVDRQTFEAAYVAYNFGIAYRDKLAEQSTDEWQASDFGKLGREIKSATGVNLFAVRKRGRPTEQRDRLLIRAVAEKWRNRGRYFELPWHDKKTGEMRWTDFSRDCERFIRLSDPLRHEMPCRQVYRNALPKSKKSIR